MIIENANVFLRARTAALFREYLKGKKIALIGVALSNTALLEFLLSLGARGITARDKKNVLMDAPPELLRISENKEVKFILGEDYLDNLDEDIIFKAPVIRRDIPELAAAERRGAVISSESALFCMLCPGKIFAVTGSDGKTTTTALIGEMLRASGADVYVGGNIGRPLISVLEKMDAGSYAVIELSSFQLFDMAGLGFAPHCAVITNITPNHLDWHTGMEEYIASKTEIFKSQNENCRLVLNLGNQVTGAADFAPCGENAPSAMYFSSIEPPPELRDCAFIRDDGFYVRKSGCEEKITDRSHLKLRGSHNAENFLAALAAVYGTVGSDAIISTAEKFSGEPHRNEFICEKRGVMYFNSSIDSTPTRTAAALKSYGDGKNIIVILGGYDKKVPFEPLVPALKQYARTAVLYGGAAPKIRAAIESANCGFPYMVAENFDDAVYKAIKCAKKGDIVLLSPACASFDCFKNFEKRGERFKELVKST